MLDFQRHPSVQAQALAESLVQAPPCPVAVAAPFAQGLSCPVLLPPCPAHVPLGEHMKPWAGRDIWLEVSRGTDCISVDRSGAVFSVQPPPMSETAGFPEETLHCHYRIETGPEQIRFTLWRTADDIRSLCRSGQSLGIQGFLGLYQELGQVLSENENRSA